MQGMRYSTLTAVVTRCLIPWQMAGARWPMLRKLGRPIRFGLVGISGILVNSAILALLVWGFRLSVWTASMLATEVAILSNFTFNDCWTFRANRHHRHWVQRLLRFNGVALGGLIITTSLLTFFTAVGELPLLLANVLAIGAATLWNYVMNSWWTWHAPQR